MKLSTIRALEPATSARDVLHRIAWAMEGQDPELVAAICGVVDDLEAAETQVALLKLEAACKAASQAEQGELPIMERLRLATVADDLTLEYMQALAPRPLRLVSNG